jgi:hypothetical protein
MKFYKYKQVQRLTFFGYDDVFHDDPASFSKKSPQSTTAGVDNDTKILRFNINRLFQTHLSQNAKIVIEQLYLPATVAVRAGPITIRMNNLNTQSHDSQNNGFNKTLIYVTEFGDETFQNHSPEMLYNFSISQNFFQNGFVEFEIQYPDIDVLLDFFDRFYISLVVYDIDEQELLLKDTPDVDYKQFGPHVNFHNGRVPK